MVNELTVIFFYQNCAFDLVWTSIVIFHVVGHPAMVGNRLLKVKAPVICYTKKVGGMIWTIQVL